MYGWARGVAALLTILAGVIFLSVPSAASAARAPEFSFNGCSVPERTQTSAVLAAGIEPEELKTHWEIDYAPAEAGQAPPEGSSAWIEAPEGSGTTETSGVVRAGRITGLSSETLYFARCRIENPLGEAVQVYAFETIPLRPRGEKPYVENVTGSSAMVHAIVVPDNYETSWRLEFASAEEGPWEAFAEGSIPASEADEEIHPIAAELNGLQPGTTYFTRLFATNANGAATIKHEEGGTWSKEPTTEAITSFETAGPPRATTFVTHSFHGEDPRALGAVTPHGLETEFRFQYLSQASFEACGWACASEGPLRDAGSGSLADDGSYPSKIVGEDLTGLDPGQTYHYRVLATNSAGSATGQEQVLTVPVEGKIEGEEELQQPTPCPNAELRSGPSALLPDCRAYEQVTPAEKAGAMDTDTYGAVTNITHVGEDGDHLSFLVPGTQWGSSPDPSISTYVFSRSPQAWEMKSVTPQPEAGGTSYSPVLFKPDLTEMALFAGWATSHVSRSPEFTLYRGPAGGPYATVLATPSASETEWVAGSADFSNLVLRTKDRSLLGHPTGTVNGSDLYEYSQGQLRQLNVLTNGSTIGSCGATLAKGYEGYQETEIQIENELKSPHTVSADGSRVFFEAVPGTNCAEQPHLYMRKDGSETVDIGQYVFLGANSQGTEVLLERVNGEERQVLLYGIEGGTLSPLFAIQGQATLGSTQRFIVSQDLSAIYFLSKQQLTAEAPPISEASEHLGFSPSNLYRYDLSSNTLSFVAQAGNTGQLGGGYSTSPDGRFFYFASTGIAGVPGGGEKPLGGATDQVYRYDARENLVQCMSCASPFDPEPRLDAYFLFGAKVLGDGVPEIRTASADGSFVFFDTTAALVPRDVDGEIEPRSEGATPEMVRSPSSDTYEWRRNGVDGCTRPQGCLALISGGLGGYKTELLGTTPSGRDVFFATHERLTGTDKDGAGDIYDARIGGGYPPAPPPAVECEGDACSHAAPAPNDTTPSSLTYQGPGNESTPAKHKRRHHRRHHKRKGNHHRRPHNHSGKRSAGDAPQNQGGLR